MHLLLDIGNARIKWAYADAGELLNEGEFVHRGLEIADVATFLTKLPVAPRQVDAVNVAGSEMAAILRKGIVDRFGVDLRLHVTEASCGPVRNGYTEADQLGVDRWAAIIGGWSHCREALCVVDAGTAVTIDLVNATGLHLGGVIVPGLQLMETALGGQTADIARFAARSEASQEDWYGKNTRAAVARGAVFTLGAAIDRAAEEFAQTEEGVHLILTGGDAEVLLGQLQRSAELRPLLVLEGLQKIIEYEGKNQA